MVYGKRDNRGFTLAELMIVVAIVIILLAVAIPSVFSLQRNLLVDDANAGASAIANAAQSEMTARKNDGTWASLVRTSSGYKNDYPQATGASSSHSRYMLASTARDQGIISDLAVEQSVRDANYIIEFDGLTASVTRVFYTSGASGFFGSGLASSAAATAVLDYYKSAPEQDNAGARASYQGCAIGLFEGTPDGATPTVALAPPSVSVNDYGKFVLTDANLHDVESGLIKGLTAQVAFSYPVEDGKTYSFTISGMTQNASGDTYTVTASDGTKEYSCSFSNAPASKTGIYTVESNSRYELDLNDLASVLEDNEAKGDVSKVWAVVSKIQDKSHKDAKSKLEAVCTVSADDCQPVSGRAYADWPAKVPTLKVYVTDPDPSNVDIDGLGISQSDAAIPDFISGTYESPQVNLVDKNGTAVDPSILNSYTGLVSDSMLKSSYSLLNNVWVNAENGSATKLPVKSDWFMQMQRENVQEGSQSYSGKVIKIDTANSIDANVLVTVGSYTSKSGSSMTVSNNNGGTITYDGKTKTNAFNGLRWPTDANAEQTIYSTGTKHDYQIYEVWLDDGISNHRVGYFQGKKWVWDDEILSDCVCDAKTKGKITADTTQLLVDSSALMGKAGTLSKYQNYSLYVRTAPKASEALDWFNEHSYTFVSYVGSTDNTTDQRGQNYSRPIRWLLENEFGASTTVAAWTVSTSGVTGSLMRDQAGQSYPTSSSKARIWYTALPAVAWNTGGQLDSRYLELPNAQLMLYDWSKSTGALNRITFASGENTMYSHNVNGETYQVRATATADLAMTPSYDHMFYRVLTYFDSDGKTRFSTGTLPQQYTVVPLDGAGDARFPTVPDKSGLTFVGWKVTAASGTFTVGFDEDGKMPKIADYVNQMKYGNVSLTALYQEGADENVGLVYLDNYSKGDGADYHYSGYLNGTSGYVEDQAADSGTVMVNSGSFESGYYLSYYVGTKGAPVVDLSRSSSMLNGKASVSEQASLELNIGGKRYAMYKVSFDSSADSQLYTTVKVAMKDATFPSVSFYCNSIFGGMLTKDEDEARTFGRSVRPWRVYNAEMFPGVMQSRQQVNNLAFLRKLLENNGTPANSTNHYVQMRNIDFASVDSSSLKQWPVAFAGTYNGGAYTLSNAEHAFTKAPLVAGSSMSKVGTVAIGSDKVSEYAEGLFPALVGRDANYKASISKLRVKVGSCTSDAELFSTVCAYAKQATFSDIKVTGKPASGKSQANIVLTGMGRNGSTDMFYASGAIIARAEKCYGLEKCSVKDIAFSYGSSKISLGNGRNVFGGICGVFDSTAITAAATPGAMKDLSADNVSFSFTSSLDASGSGAVSCGGLFGRLYPNSSPSFTSDQGWSVKDVTISNSSSVTNANTYAGIISGSYGNSLNVYSGSFDCSNVVYANAGKRYSLYEGFTKKRSIASNGRISGSEWFCVNSKKASELITLLGGGA